jgi:hypothetical protein
MANKTFRLTILLAIGLLPGACSAEERRSDSVSQAATAGGTTTEPGPQQMEGAMNIRITAGERTLTARLENSAAARDFAALLPVELTLKDYASTEKIADLPRKLSTEGAPDGVDPEVGDIAYYAPWGNIAIYYRDFDYSRGLVRLGRIEGGVEALRSLEGRVTIEIVESQAR